MIKRVLFLTVGILSLMLAACETKAINNGKKENKMKTIELTKADFLKKIVDYEKNPEEWINRRLSISMPLGADRVKWWLRYWKSWLRSMTGRFMFIR